MNLMKFKTGNLEFTDMSCGSNVDGIEKTRMIKEVLENLKEGQCHTSISTGNFLVIGLKYDSEYQIFITENYFNETIYVRNGDPTIEDAFVYEGVKIK